LDLREKDNKKQITLGEMDYLLHCFCDDKGTMARAHQK